MNRKVDAILKKYIDKKFFSGAVCKISVDNQIIYSKSFGYSCVRPQKNKMNENVIFDIASVTKIITSVIILILITQKLINLDDILRNCLKKVKESEILNKKIGEVTIEELLTHNSGILAWYPFYCSKKSYFSTLEEVIGRSELYNGTLYSDLNFMILGEIIKEKTGMTLDKAVEFMIAKPLGLKTLSYTIHDKQHVACTEFGNRIEQNMVKERGLVFDGWRDINNPIWGEVNDGNSFYHFKGQAGHAGIFSNAEDLISISNLFLNRGDWKGEKIIDKEIVKYSMTEIRKSRGLGWQFSDVFPKGLGHSGFTGTSIYIIPNKKMAIVCLTNRLHVDNPQNINSFRKELHETILKSYFE